MEIEYMLKRIRPSKKESRPDIIILTGSRSTTVGRFLVHGVDIGLLSKTTPLMISRKHATLSVENNRVFVIDHNSINGVYIRNKRVNAGIPHEVQVGDKLAFGCGVDNNPPEFEYILEVIPLSVGNIMKFPEDLSHSPAKRRKIAESPVVTILESNNAQIKEQEEKIAALSTNLKEKEETYKKLLNQLQKTESGMLEKLEKQKFQLETERQIAENNLKCLLEKELFEKESLLRSEYDLQLQNLQNEKDLVEQNLQEELSKKLSEKDEAYQKELELQKIELEKSMSHKESEKQKLIDELTRKESLIESYKSVEENQKQLETCLEELQKEILEKDNQLKVQKEYAKKVEHDAKQTVIQTMEDEFTCIICQELFIEATTLPCAHTFCNMCLRMWLRKKKNCPVCRRRIKEKAVRSLVLDSVVEKMVESMDENDKKRRADIKKEREAQKKRDDSTEDPEGIRDLFHSLGDDDTEDVQSVLRTNDRVVAPRNRREHRRRSRSRSPRNNHRHRNYHDNRYQLNNTYHHFQNTAGFLNQLNNNYNNNNGGRFYSHDRSGNFQNYFPHGFHQQNHMSHYHSTRCYNCGGLDHLARQCPRGHRS